MFNLNNVLNNMSEEKADQMLSQLDEEQLRKALILAINRYVVPHLADIRYHAKHEYEDRETVRKHYESMSESQQQDEFEEAYASLLDAVATLRDDPIKGGRKIKSILRDPWTVEALLLIFNNEEHIDEEYATQMKEFVTKQLRWMGIHALPEIYTREEARQVIEELYPNKDPDALLKQYGYDDQSSPSGG